MIDWSKYPNFSEDEFRCKGNNCCGHAADMDPDFIYTLQSLRNAYGKAIIITSGYRCPDHNAAVSDSGRSGPHTTGKAADILVSGRDAYDLLKLAVLHPFTGYGIHQKGVHTGRFIHLDTLTGNHRPMLFSY
jgi:zinc D-Ala-D-Ala carboxypeptidase